MPAFDPVRDAVLNSPVLSFPTLDRDTHRRATDLAVLLNDQDQHPHSPHPPSATRPSSLSHILLHPDPDRDVLSAPALSRQPRSSLPTPTLPPSQPHVPSPRASSPSATSEPSSHPPITPTTGDSPSMPHPAPTTLPYNPRRITPAGSVLIPLSPAEIEKYRNFVGKGTQRLSKRKRIDDATDEESGLPPFKKPSGIAGVVAKHYNARPEVGVVQRFDSPIIGLKNFNNWIKSVLITRFAHPALEAAAAATTDRTRKGGGGGGGGGRSSGRVLDMGCGKGGDLIKWGKAPINEYFGVDIAGVSIDQARSRWESMASRKFNAQFATLDCYSEPLSKVFSPAKLEQLFDVVSMQFCMHYAFESLAKVRCMLNNVSRWLRPGGVFIGTIPNAGQLLERLNDLPADAKELSFGNSIYKIQFEERDYKPVFGHKYWFYLQDAVENVPEYIVHWTNFVQMAGEYHLFPVYKEEFHHVFTEHRNDPGFGSLMVRMKVVDANGESSMDLDQWDAANIYLAFAFEKR